ncbi:hypothetical protein EZV62_018452 [Acer yangbiense]|uniref:CCHC-type domain-containing protein n=1 Tax=Acer yangbiense TaxID=1000413 RepID=A0A5C7HK10_9ROSI|nr:hypothetical protein EZV62_018452 [Acer yangbiense]
MGDSEIAKLYEKLSIADEDSAIYEMAEEDQLEGVAEVDICLVGKIISGKKANREAFKNLIEKLWSQFGRVEIESVGVNIFVFHFNNQEERNRIWNRGPWYFDNSLIALEKPEGMGNISNLKFNKVEMWIQIHDVPIMCMNRKAAKWMANQIGWLKLKLDKSNNIVMVSLKYERLPEFCYVCGRIGHGSKDCSDEEAKNGALMSDSSKYGSWMRAYIPDKQKLRSEQQIEEYSKVQSRGLKDRNGVKEGGLQKPIIGSLSTQVEELTDSDKGQKEESNVSHTKTISSISGLRSSQSLRLRIEGPIEEVKLIKKKAEVDGKVNYGSVLKVVNSTEIVSVPALQVESPIVVSDPSEETIMVCSSQPSTLSSPIKTNTRNWKRLERLKKTEIEMQNQSTFFQNLQMVSTKGKKSSNGIDSTTMSKSKFNIAGKRSRLGKYKNYPQFSSKEKGTLSSSLKRWDVQFGKRKLVIGSGVENGVNKKGRISASIQDVINLAEPGCSGGLMLMWKKEMKVTVLSFSVGHIDVRIQMDDGFMWRFSGMYGDPSPGKRVRSWELLRRLREVDRLPWICGGDFNELLCMNEKVRGPKFTWNNKREGKLNIQERIDRILANNLWRDRFEYVKVKHLGFHTSDHRLILLKCDKSSQHMKSSSPRCTVCSDPVETSAHAIFWCKEAKKCWRMTDIVCPLDEVNQLTAIDVFIRKGKPSMLVVSGALSLLSEFQTSKRATSSQLVSVHDLKRALQLSSRSIHDVKQRFQLQFWDTGMLAEAVLHAHV